MDAGKTGIPKAAAMILTEGCRLSKDRKSTAAQASPVQPAIGYLRVSTQEQGRSGLGLAAQSADIEAFGAREGFSIKSWHQDVQTGAGSVCRWSRSVRPSVITSWSSSATRAATPRIGIRINTAPASDSAVRY